MRNRPTVFVTDTQVLWWYLRLPGHLSEATRQVLLDAEAGNATVIVPAIVIAELYYLSVRVNEPFTLPALLDDLSSREWIELSDLGQAQLEYLDRLPEIPEMHDKLIAAESIVNGAPLLTSDRVLRASPQVETVW